MHTEVLCDKLFWYSRSCSGSSFSGSGLSQRAVQGVCPCPGRWAGTLWVSGSVPELRPAAGLNRGPSPPVVQLTQSDCRNGGSCADEVSDDVQIVTETAGEV